MGCVSVLVMAEGAEERSSGNGAEGQLLLQKDAVLCTCTACAYVRLGMHLLRCAAVMTDGNIYSTECNVTSA